jgi:CYTH domain-containing protein
MSTHEFGHETPKTGLEVERKFLVRNLPNELNSYEHQQIRQGYLVIGEDGSEARLRDRAGDYTMTVKSKGTLSRGEWETKIDEEQFMTLWPATNGKRVEKTRFTIPYGEFEIELDVYEGDLIGLVSAEVEFPDEESANSFVVPEWFAVDVTAEKSFKNQNLALHGLPS